MLSFSSMASSSNPDSGSWVCLTLAILFWTAMEALADPPAKLQIVEEIYSPFDKTIELIVSFSFPPPNDYDRFCRHDVYKMMIDRSKISEGHPETYPKPEVIASSTDPELPLPFGTWNFSMKGLYPDTGYRMTVESQTCYTKKAIKTVFEYKTTSCLKASSYNLTLCAPPTPTITVANVLRNNATCLTILHLEWVMNSPNQNSINKISDNRTLGNSSDVNLQYEVTWQNYPANRQGENFKLQKGHSMTGSKTQHDIVASEIGFYSVFVRAISPGGMGEQAIHKFEITACEKIANITSYSMKRPPVVTELPPISSPEFNPFQLYMTIGAFIVLICIMVLFGVYAQKYKLCRYKKFFSDARLHTIRSELILKVDRPISYVSHILYDYNPDENEISLCPPYQPVPFRNLEMIDLLGAGIGGEVRRGILRLDNSYKTLEVAVKKMLNDANPDDRRALIREIDVLKHLSQHPNVIRMIGDSMSRDGSRIYLLLEYCSLGDLQSYLRNHHKNGLSMMTDLELRQNLLTYSLQIARGMAHLHASKVIHRDLAARNVLLTNDGLVKVADFGLSKITTGFYQQLTTTKLPWKWLSPEALDSRLFSDKSDVWAFGVVMHEIFSLGRLPYPSIELADELSRFLKDGQRMERPEKCTTEVYELMKKCWQKDPNDRPDFTTICRELERIIEMYYYITLEDETDSDDEQMIGKKTMYYVNMCRQPDVCVVIEEV